MNQILLVTGCLFFMSDFVARNVGIGTINPKARLHVADSAVVFTGPSTLPAAGLLPITGTGNRMMWYPAKAAIRAGGVTGTHWDETYIRKYSAEFGNSNRAAGDYATSVGRGNSSLGNGTFTAGFSNTATGAYATALCTETEAQAYSSLVIGRYNILNGNSTEWIDNDPVFVIGNGYLTQTSLGIFAIQRRNAFSIDKLGNTTVNGTATLKKTVIKDSMLIQQSLNIGLTPNADTLKVYDYAIFNGKVKFNSSLGVDVAYKDASTIQGNNTVSTNLGSVIILNGKVTDTEPGNSGGGIPRHFNVFLSNGSYEGQLLTLVNWVHDGNTDDLQVGIYKIPEGQNSTNCWLPYTGGNIYLLTIKSSISFVWSQQLQQWITTDYSKNS